MFLSFEIQESALGNTMVLPLRNLEGFGSRAKAPDRGPEPASPERLAPYLSPT